MGLCSHRCRGKLRWAQWVLTSSLFCTRVPAAIGKTQLGCGPSLCSRGESLRDRRGDKCLLSPGGPCLSPGVVGGSLLSPEDAVVLVEGMQTNQRWVLSAGLKAFHKRVGIISLFLGLGFFFWHKQFIKKSFPARLLIDKVGVLQPLCPG